MAKKTHYAVKKGHKCGVIVRSWGECEELVKGFAGAIFQGFTNEADARAFIQGPNPSWVKKPVKKDKYGFRKERYYTVNGVLHADYGRTVGVNCDINKLYDGDAPPWK